MWGGSEEGPARDAFTKGTEVEEKKNKMLGRKRRKEASQDQDLGRMGLAL